MVVIRAALLFLGFTSCQALRDPGSGAVRSCPGEKNGRRVLRQAFLKARVDIRTAGGSIFQMPFYEEEFPCRKDGKGFWSTGLLGR
jgi:hypothetical protein